MDLAPYIERIRSTVPAARSVRFAISLPAAVQDAAQIGAGDQWVYVIPGGTSASANPVAAGAVTQQVTVRFSVVIVARNVRDTRGEGATDDLNAVLSPLRKALQGWAPAWANTPTELGSGRIAGFNDFVSAWQEDFLTGYLESNEETQ
jgi:hypothetical protein